MKNTKLKIVVSIAIFVQLVWFFLPQVEYRWMTEDALVVISYSGFESKLDVAAWVSWASLAATALVLISLFYFGTAARYWALAYMVASAILVVPFTGLTVETGLSMTLRDTLNMLVGAAIALSFWPASNESKDSGTVP